MLDKKKPRIYGDGKQTRDFTFISNVVDANILASKSENALGRSINVATNKKYSLLELVEMLNELTGCSAEPAFSEERKGDVKHSLADITLAGKLLGYSPKIGFREGLRKTIESMEKK